MRSGFGGGAPAPAGGPLGAAALLALIRTGLRTRTELARATGLARSTIESRLAALAAAGLITAEESGVSTGGRPALRFAFTPRARVVLAVDFGARHARAAITDLDSRTLADAELPLDIACGPDPALDWLIGTGHQLLERAGARVGELAGVGIGLPGPVEHTTGRPISPPIMPGWDGTDVPKLVSAAFPVPVLVDNDVNVMALGEHATAFPEVADLLFVKVATGIGSGIINNGQLIRGAQGAAGDLGHIRLPGAEAMCRCGNVGCVEAVASGGALAAALRAKGLATDDSRDIVELVRAGNLTAAAAVREAGRQLGEVLAGCVSLLNPSVIVVGGELAMSGEMLLAGVREGVYARSLPLATQHLQIVASRTGREAAIVGASTMVCDHVLSPQVLDIQLS